MFRRVFKISLQQPNHVKDYYESYYTQTPLITATRFLDYCNDHNIFQILKLLLRKLYDTYA